MYTCDIFTASCDEDFTLRAFADFLERKTEKYEELQATLTEALELLENPDTDLDLEHVERHTIRQFLIDKGWDPDIPVLTSKGYVQVEDLIASYLWDEVINENCGLNAGQETVFRVTDAAGNLVAYSHATDVLREIGETIVNSQVLMQSTRAMGVKVSRGIEAAYTYLNEQLGRLGHTASKIQAAAKSFYGKILDAAQSTKDFLSKVSSAISLDAIAEHTDTPLNSQVYLMTGANPACALDFTNVGKAVGSIFTGGAYLVYKLVQAGQSWWDKLVQKIATKIAMTTTNPYDIEVINYANEDNVVPATKDLGYILSFDDYEIANLVATYNSEQNAQTAASQLNELYGGSSLYFRTIFGEILFQQLQFNVRHVLTYSVYWTGAVVIKPFMVTEDAIAKWTEAVFGNYAVLNRSSQYHIDVNHGFHAWNKGYVDTPSTVTLNQGYEGYIYRSVFTPEFAAQNREEICQKILAMKQAGGLYYDLPSDVENLTDLTFCEGLARAGLINGFYGLKLLIYAAYIEFNDVETVFRWYEYNDGGTMHRVLFEPRIMLDRDPKFGYKTESLDFTITNQDLMEAACGYRVTGGTTFFDTCPVGPSQSWVEDSGNAMLLTSSIIPQCSTLMSLLRDVKERQNEVSIDQYPFLPYRRNSESFGDARYRVVTDTENMEKFQSFWTKVVVAVTVVTIVAVTGIIAHKITRKIAMARQQRYYQYQQKLYNSLNDPSQPALTAREYRRMMRFEQRLNAVDTAATGASSDIMKYFTGVDASSELPGSTSLSSMDISYVAGLIK